MLLRSERLTKKDIEYWPDFAEYVTGKVPSKSLGVMTAKTIEAIATSAKSGPTYVSVSWGKDSVVVAHLAQLAGLELPYVWLKESPMHNPHCEDVRDVYLSRFPETQYHEVVLDYGRVGFTPFLDSGGDSIYFHAIADAVNKTFGKRITGIRSVESNKRRLRMSHYGIETKNTVAPIGWWSTEAVFAYLIKHDLPIHPNYAMTGGGRHDPLRIRVDCIAGTQGNGIGREEWEREYYGDIVNRLAANKRGAI